MTVPLSSTGSGEAEWPYSPGTGGAGGRQGSGRLGGASTGIHPSDSAVAG